MELKRALEILDLIRPGGGGQVINLKRNPNAIGMMGLAPFEVESTASDEARMALNKYLNDYPEEERPRIRRQLWEDYRDIQSVKGAGVDLSFLDEEFGPVETK